MAGASPLLASPGDPADLREFGQVKGWKDAENEDVYPKAAGPPWRAIREQGGDGHWNLGVEWDEPREFSEVHVAFQEPVPADSVRIEYWVSSWPPPEGRGGWTETDTPWRRAWKLVHPSSRVENGEIVFTFNPLSADENPRAKNRPGYQPKFRRALKMRLRMESSFLPVLTRFQVFGAARWSEREVRIETGCEGKLKSEPQFQIYNGRLVEKRVDGDATRLRLMYLEHLPESNDGTLLTMNAGGLQFGVAVDDVILEFNGREIPGPWALRWAMSLAGVGSVVKLVVRRGAGQLLDLEVKLGDSSALPALPEEEPAQ